MAGHRRGTGRPTREQARAERRRQYLHDRLGRARSPVERLTAATEYARGALARLDPVTADALARALVEHLTHTVDAATGRQRSTR